MFGAVALMIGLFGFLIARRHVLEEQATQQAEEHAKPITAAPAAPKPSKAKPAALNGQPAGDGWQSEAEAEYAAVAESRRLAALEMAERLKGMDYGQLVSATNCLRSVQMSGVEGFADQRPEVVAEAEKINPTLIAAYRRELAIERGELPGHYSLAKRKELWREFAAAVGWSEFCLTHRFNDLTQQETDAAIDAARRLKADGLKNLNKEERRLLLKAGAYPVFLKELGK